MSRGASVASILSKQCVAAGRRFAAERHAMNNWGQPEDHAGNDPVLGTEFVVRTAASGWDDRFEPRQPVRSFRCRDARLGQRRTHACFGIRVI